MYDAILFPTDGSDGAEAVLEPVLDLAAGHGATVHVLHVADTTHDSVTRIGGDVVDVLEREGERIVEAVAERAADRGVDAETAVLQGRVAGTIIEYATEHDVDLVAMPTHGRTGVQRLLLGSVTERVVREAPLPVLTLRPDGDAARYPYETLLVPTDGSDCASAALDRAVDLASATAATVHVLSVVDVASLGVDYPAEVRVDLLQDRAEELVSAASSVAETAGLEDVVEAVEFESAIYRAIRDYVAEHDVDLVVMGTHGRTGLERYLLGSVAEKTVRTSPVPVLTVPDPSATSAES